MIYLNQLCSEGLLSTINFTATAHSELIPIVTPSSGTALTGIFGGHRCLYVKRAMNSCMSIPAWRRCRRQRTWAATP